MTVAKLHDEPSTGDREQRHRRAKRAAVMTALSCFLVSANSAFANGGGGLPPVVVHPVHNFAPVTHTLTNTNPTHGFTSNSADSKSPIGSSGSNYSNYSNNS